MGDSSGLTTYTYDALSRRTSVVAKVGTYTPQPLTYTYDAVGQQRSMTSSAGRFTYTWDAVGQSVGLSNPLTTWVYDAAGQTLAKYNGNSTAVTYTYDAAGRITQYDNFKLPSYTSLMEIDVRFDKVGNILQVANSASTNALTTYTYDQANQLQSSHQDNGPLTTYTYDGAGNMVSGLANSTYDAANQLIRQAFFPPTTYTYDDAGNLKRTQIGTSAFSTFTWDAENRLATTNIFLEGGPYTNVYNADGLRVRRQGKIDGVQEDANFVWDGQNLHIKTDSTSNDYYAYEPRLYGNLVSAGTSGRWYQYDERGSTALLSDASGDATDMYTYTPWGFVTADDINTARNPFMFQGRVGYYCDDDDLDKGFPTTRLPLYVRARFYQPGIARWVNPDPLANMVEWVGHGGKIGVLSPERLAIMRNLYAYVSNNPVNLNDPSGLRPAWQDKCDPKCTYLTPTPPPVLGPTPGSACWYPNRRVCFLTLCWESQCVCQCVGDSYNLDCIRACIMCSHANGAPINIDAERFCEAQCPPLTPNERRRLDCCLNKDWNQGGCASPIFQFPPHMNPNPHNNTCTGIRVP